MPDYLGLAQQQDQNNQVTTTDLFGIKSPLSLAGQPALPQGGPAAAGTAAATPTRAGSGAATPATPQGPGSFGDLAQGAMPEGGGSGGPGPGEAQGGFGVEGALGQSPSSFGLSVDVPGVPASIGIGPSGTLGASVNTGNPQVDSVINSAIGLAGKFGGFATGVSLPGLVAALSSSPFVTALAGAVSSVGAPLALVSLAHAFAKGNPQSTTNLLSHFQQAINDPDPSIAESAANAQLEAQQAAAAASAGQSFTFTSPEAAAVASAMGVPGISSYGGGYAIGQNTGAALGQSPNLNTPEAQAQNISQAPAFAALANAMGFGREDASGPTGPGPAGTGPSGPGTASGDSSTGGDPAGSPY